MKETSKNELGKYATSTVTQFSSLNRDWLSGLRSLLDAVRTSISNHLERITAVPRATTIRTMVMMGWLSIEMAHYCCTWVFRKPTCISHQLPVPVLLILGCRGLSRHRCSCWPACFDGCAGWR